MRVLRVIPCLDVAERKVVKGRKFRHLRLVGDAVALAQDYYRQGADELIFLDVMATVEYREPFYDLIRDVAADVFVPLTVGGGIHSVRQVERLLKSGADKVAVGSYGVINPKFLREIADQFGSQSLVVSVDVKRMNDSWMVFLEGGRRNSGIPALSWIKQVEEWGAGEILLNSIDADGMQEGYDIPLLRAVSQVVSLPLIASGGAGSPDHLSHLLKKVEVEAVLLASLLHERKATIAEIKAHLSKEGVRVRC